MSQSITKRNNMNTLEKITTLLSKSTVIEVNGYLLHNWEFTSPSDCDGDMDDALVFSYTDDEGQIYGFEFHLANIKEAELIGTHTISLLDNNNDMVEINCFKLTPMDANNLK